MHLCRGLGYLGEATECLCRLPNSLTKPVPNIVLDFSPAGILSTIGDDLGPDLNAIVWGMTYLAVVRVGPAVVMVCRATARPCV